MKGGAGGAGSPRAPQAPGNGARHEQCPHRADPREVGAADRRPRHLDVCVDHAGMALADVVLGQVAVEQHRLGLPRHERDSGIRTIRTPRATRRAPGAAAATSPVDQPLEVSAIGRGTWQFGGEWDKAFT